MKQITIPVTFDVGTLEEIGMGGYKTTWVSSTHEGVELDITAGAGLGNSRLEATARRGDERVYAKADITKVARALWPQLTGLLGKLPNGGNPRILKPGGNPPMRKVPPYRHLVEADSGTRHARLYDGDDNADAMAAWSKAVSEGAEYVTLESLVMPPPLPENPGG